MQVVVPDAPELARAEKLFGNALSLLDGVSFGALTGASRGGLLSGLFASVAPAEERITPADVYLVVNLSVRAFSPRLRCASDAQHASS